MSEQYFLQKCIVAAEDVKGSYNMMVNLDVEKNIKQEYTKMISDVTNHLNFLVTRLQYLNQINK